MSSTILMLGILALLALGYLLYGKFVSHSIGIDPGRKTPALEFNDGVDYVPARHWLVLFGHHFSSICGAGPIVGPVLAVAYWGWGVSLIWIIAGSVFFGAVADFSSLLISVRNGGRSISEISRDVISPKARFLFSLFIWLSLILVITVFSILAAKTFTTQPKIVVPSLGIIPLAIFAGYLLYRRQMSMVPVTIFGLILMGGVLYFGKGMPISWHGSAETNLNIWLLILFTYCFIASVTPVQFLLQPRDYFAGFILAAAIGTGIVGLFISNQPMSPELFKVWKPDPKIWPGAGPLWPLLFVTIACGAISGFHSLVSSGTTCKQLSSEVHACRIGYGGMLTEGLVASLVVFCVGAGLSSVELNEFLAPGKGGPIAAFGAGFGNLSKPVLGTYGNAFAIMALNAFILTTLDTATRIGRYLTSELFGIQNRYWATLMVLVVSGFLAFTGQWQKIWPVFGASNQLVAALSLLVVSCWLSSQNRKNRFALIPSLFMLVTTIAAFAILGWGAFRHVDDLANWTPQWTIGIASLTLIVLSFMIFWEGFGIIFKRKRQNPI